MYRYSIYLWILIPTLLLFAACNQNLAVQPKALPQGKSEFFSDSRSDRPPVADTVTQLRMEQPIEWKLSDLKRGQQRYAIYCSVCHDDTGSGNGPVVRRGFPQPPALDSKQTRLRSDQDLERIVANGIGIMSGFASSIPDRDRRLIAGYVRVLQLRTHVPSHWLSTRDLQKLREAK